MGYIFSTVFWLAFFYPRYLFCAVLLPRSTPMPCTTFFALEERLSGFQRIRQIPEAKGSFQLDVSLRGGGGFAQGGGVAANVAYWLGALGIDVSMIGVIADDPAGFFLRTDLERVNVKCYLKISTENPSAGILIVVEEDGERSFIINGKCLDELTLKDVPLTEIQGGNLFYTSAYNIENSPIKETIYHILKKSKTDKYNSFEVMYFSIQPQCDG